MVKLLPIANIRAYSCQFVANQIFYIYRLFTAICIH